MPVCIALLGSHLGERVGEGGYLCKSGVDTSSAAKVFTN